MKFRTTSLAAALLLGLIPAVCRAQEFSADVVYFAPSRPNAPTAGTGTSSRPSSKLYVSKDKMRLETRGMAETILLVDRGENTAVAMFPARKAYQPLASGPSEYFRVENPDDACPEWQRVAEQKMVCEKVGHETVDGRETVKYRNKGASDAATSAVWIDAALKFVVKWEGAGAAAEVRNIKEAPQAADLFAVPSSYQGLKPQKGSSKGFAQRSR
ncbi:MAG: hypothetical protein LAN64_17660 [Acidobacteriia bacterium]|nr:hypothetical protein [Terriglobia bacterium]